MIRRQSNKKLSLIGDNVEEVMSLMKMALMFSGETITQFSIQHLENVNNVSEFDPNEYCALVCVEDPLEKLEIVESILPFNTTFFTLNYAKMLGDNINIQWNCIIYPEVILFDNNFINDGCIIKSGSILPYGTNITNKYSFIDYNTVIR